jgi:hypothetical protein
MRYAKIHPTVNAAINFIKYFLVLMYLASLCLMTRPHNTGSLLDVRAVRDKCIDRSKVLEDKVYVNCPHTAKELKK